MARFSRIEVFLKMKQTGIVPVFYHKDIELCKQVVKACYNGGVRVFEFTNRGDFAHEVFAALLRFAESEMPEMILGVGSVFDAGTASLYIQNGANFIVSPVLNADMAKVCNRRKVMWVPGCGSVSEISFAEELGAELVKIFPGQQVGGPKFVEAVKGPMPWSNIMPTGGVDTSEENLQSWFEAGVSCTGIGSQLFPKQLLEQGNFEKITEECKRMLTVIDRIVNASS